MREASLTAGLGKEGPATAWRVRGAGGVGRHGASAPCRHCASIGIFRRGPENSGRSGMDPEFSGSFRMTSFLAETASFYLGISTNPKLVKIFLEVLTIRLKLPMILV